MSRKRTEIATPLCGEIDRMLKSTDDPRERERLLAVRMATTGRYTLAMIAESVGRARSAVQQWLDRFEQGGIEALLQRKKSPGRPPALPEPVQEQMREKLREGAWRTAGQFRQWLTQTHGITLSVGGSYYWLGKSRASLKAPRPCHTRQKAGDLERFKTEGWAQALEALPIPKGEPVRFWCSMRPVSAFTPWCGTAGACAESAWCGPFSSDLNGNTFMVPSACSMAKRSSATCRRSPAKRAGSFSARSRRHNPIPITLFSGMEPAFISRRPSPRPGGPT